MSILCCAVLHLDSRRAKGAFFESTDFGGRKALSLIAIGLQLYGMDRQEITAVSLVLRTVGMAQ